MSKAKQPKISVIVPIYKVEKYLVQCIDSILNQTLKDIEVILVDEGDRDACRFIIDHYEQNDKRVKAIHEKNGGYGASVNKGMEIAVGEYISIIESDDFIEPTMYEEMYKKLKNLMPISLKHLTMNIIRRIFLLRTLSSARGCKTSMQFLRTN